ncbi:MAG: hypothetical protein D6732_23360 [Methanobacteriota archaeon]|nr:MAG: hypothetical protein D6732_23360 [Euryarchaeota archaeon]
MGVLDGRDAEIDFVDSIFSRSLFKGTFRGHVFEAAMNAKVHDAVSGGNITFHSVPFPDAEVILPSHRFIRGNVDAFVIRPSQYQKSEVAEVLGEEDAAILMNGKDFVQAPKLAVVDYKALNNGERDKVMSSYSKQVALYAIKAGGLMEKAMLHELLSGIARESGSDVDSGWITEKVDAFYDRFNEDNPERAIRIATMMDLGFTVGLMEPKHGEMAGNLLNAVSTMDIKKIRDALEAIRSDFLDGATIQKYMMDYREKRDNLTMAEHDYRQFELAVESLLQLRTPDQDNGDERNNGMGADKEIKRELIDQIKKQEAALAKIKLQLDSLTKEYNDGRERLLRLMSEAGVESFSTHVDGFDKVEGIVCTPKKTIVDIKAARERISIGLEEASERIGDIKDRQLESLVKSISGVSPSLKECVHVDEGKPYIKFTAVPEKGLQPSIMSEPQVP